MSSPKQPVEPKPATKEPPNNTGGMTRKGFGRLIKQAITKHIPKLDSKST